MADLTKKKVMVTNAKSGKTSYITYSDLLSATYEIGRAHV